MATPLKLKSERVGKATLASSSPYLSVLVDTGVFHLDYEFDYSLPAKFDLAAGDWVSVPFNGRNCLGLITKRSENSALSKISTINRGAKGPYISPEHLALYKAVADRWAVPIFDVLRFVTKYRTTSTDSFRKVGSGKRSYLQLPPNQSEVSALREVVSRIAKSGSTLLIVPEARLISELEGEGYEVAARGGVLSPIRYQNLIVLREDSEHHYELKSPGFNSRDVALLRSEILSENLLFIGYSPSYEMSKLLDSGYVTFKKSSGNLKVTAKPSIQGELIPSALIKEFKTLLTKGPVLVIAPSKGYGLALSCAACRNIAKCSCGGKLTKATKSSAPHCVICIKEYSDWRCNYCKSERIYLLGRGIERIAEEFGKSFVNTAIHIATSDKEIFGEVPKQSIVLSTIGSAPDLEYSGVLFLEGLNLGSDMRSEERFLTTVFRYSACAKGNVLIVERAEHPVVNSLIKWNLTLLIRRLLTELEDAQLPPFQRHILLKSEDSERIYAGLLASLREGRLPMDTRILHLGSGVISIFFSLKSAKQVIAFMYQYQKKRSMSGKSLLKLRVDPYLLG
ncbi:MAG: hypothetical protein RL193_1071 [Actinomycetota bacterium]|jgi:primosomal protein N' (replication factor Y)